MTFPCKQMTSNEKAPDKAPTLLTRSGRCIQSGMVRCATFKSCGGTTEKRERSCLENGWTFEIVAMEKEIQLGKSLHWLPAAKKGSYLEAMQNA